MRTGQAAPGRHADILRELRAATADEHTAVERTLDLLDPTLSRERLSAVLGRLHGFWVAAETGLQRWAERHPSDAEAVGWARRRRAALFAADVGALGGRLSAGPALPAVADTDAVLRRMVPGRAEDDVALVAVRLGNPAVTEPVRRLRES
jgi:heme oxygenase